MHIYITHAQSSQKMVPIWYNISSISKKYTKVRLKLKQRNKRIGIQGNTQLFSPKKSKNPDKRKIKTKPDIYVQLDISIPQSISFRCKNIFYEEGRWISKLKLWLVDSKVCLAAIGSTTTFMNHRTIIVKLNSKSFKDTHKLLPCPRIVSGEQSWAHRISIEAITDFFYISYSKGNKPEEHALNCCTILEPYIVFEFSRLNKITEARQWKTSRNPLAVFQPLAPLAAFVFIFLHSSFPRRIWKWKGWIVRLVRL